MDALPVYDLITPCINNLENTSLLNHINLLIINTFHYMQYHPPKISNTFVHANDQKVLKLSVGGQY